MAQKTIYLTLWYYSEYRGFWITTGDTALKPVKPVYEGQSSDALRFLKYAHFVKSNQYRFYLAGVDPNKDDRDPFIVDSAYLSRLGVLIYQDGVPCTKIIVKKEKYQVASEYILSCLAESDRVLMTDLSEKYSTIEIKLAIKKLSNQVEQQDNFLVTKTQS